jgi:16S rRNA (cytidine1402-2'-O)-methyltransferase
VLESAEPAPGVLYLVGTPIGNLEDLSPRARRVLAGVDHLACEDTRRSGLLLQALGCKRPLLSFHAHNGRGLGGGDQRCGPAGPLRSW